MKERTVPCEVTFRGHLRADQRIPKLSNTEAQLKIDIYIIFRRLVILNIDVTVTENSYLSN